MKVYTGQFRYISENEVEVIVGTTIERVERQLVVMMENYIEWINDHDAKVPETFDELQQLGWDNEWYDVQDPTPTDLLTDKHILAYVMGEI
tara:strand:+ start:2648 stop:2920 length:273 start_codon:yes stop_codon:yes gene_type:complete